MTYCHTCDRCFKSHGIANHRAMHRRRAEDCTITLSDGTWKYAYSERQPAVDAETRGAEAAG